LLKPRRRIAARRAVGLRKRTSSCGDGAVHVGAFAAYDRREIVNLKTIVLRLELQRRRPQLFDASAG
jgi:hypothetical protein